jgi:hypothetical protein
MTTQAVIFKGNFAVMIRIQENSGIAGTMRACLPVGIFLTVAGLTPFLNPYGILFREFGNTNGLIPMKQESLKVIPVESKIGGEDSTMTGRTGYLPMCRSLPGLPGRSNLMATLTGSSPGCLIIETLYRKGE